MMNCNLKSYSSKALDLRFNCFVWLGAKGKNVGRSNFFRKLFCMCTVWLASVILFLLRKTAYMSKNSSIKFRNQTLL